MLDKTGRVEEEAAGKTLKGKNLGRRLERRVSAQSTMEKNIKEGKERKGRKEGTRKEHVAGADVVTQHSTLADFK